MCKNAPNKALHYKDTPVHRIVKDFIAQGGDVTRADGSGGEVHPRLEVQSSGVTDIRDSPFTDQGLPMQKRD